MLAGINDIIFSIFYAYYGGGVTLELEAYLTDRVVFLINARERMLFGSSIGKFHTQFGIGVKFIIN